MSVGKLLQNENDRLTARKQYITDRLANIMAESNRLVEEAEKIDIALAQNQGAMQKLLGQDDG